MAVAIHQSVYQFRFSQQPVHQKFHRFFIEHISMSLVKRQDNSLHGSLAEHESLHRSDSFFSVFSLFPVAAVSSNTFTIEVPRTPL